MTYSTENDLRWQEFELFRGLTSILLVMRLKERVLFNEDS